VATLYRRLQELCQAHPPESLVGTTVDCVVPVLMNPDQAGLMQRLLQHNNVAGVLAINDPDDPVINVDEGWLLGTLPSAGFLERVFALPFLAHVTGTHPP
jgi:hypothetical protein